MTQKLLCVCAVCTLLFVFAATNVACAEEAAAACPPCVVAHAAPCNVNPCYVPPVAYRVGLFGAVRPVFYAPVYRPVYVAPRYYHAPHRYPVGFPVYAW